MPKTQPNSSKENNQGPQPEWHFFDASTEVLGRLATRVASLLNAKHRIDYAPNKVAPVNVVVINTDKLLVTGNKEEQKMYRHYSGYPGGLKERTLADQRQRDSRVIVEHAISGMLPKNNLRVLKLKHLHLYTGNEHPHLPQIKPSQPAK